MTNISDTIYRVECRCRFELFSFLSYHWPFLCCAWTM